MTRRTLLAAAAGFALLLAVLAVLAAGAATPAAAGESARSADLAGWRTARWGMDSAALDLAFGDALAALPQRRVWGGAHAVRYLPEVALGGVGFRAFFQMNDDDGRLQQVLLEPLRRGRPAARFGAVQAALESAYGPPDGRCIASDAAVPVSVTLSWRFATTTVHLVFFDYVSSAIIYEQPSRHGDRRGADSASDRANGSANRTGDAIAGADARTMPRGLRVRYHATARAELAPPGCAASSP